MSKSRNKHGSELEQMRGEVKRLRKQVRQLQKLKHWYEHIEDEVAEEIQIKEVCSECAKGEIVVTDFGKFQTQRCTVCDWKKVKR